VNGRSFHPSSSSFRDPAGFVFENQGQIYRQINQVGKTDFDHFINSGLYNELLNQELIIAHREVEASKFAPDVQRYKVIKPRRLPFVSYPYEWTFSQLKAAALLTLKIQKAALTKGLILKDASAYNVQFIGGQAILIDTLSFRIRQPGAPWEGYRQFCEHFLGPLAIAAFISPNLLKLAAVFLDGLPLQLACQMLPARARLRKGLLAHLYLHAAFQKRFDKAKPQVSAKPRQVGELAMEGLLSSLQKTVEKLRISSQKTQWGDYYNATNYSKAAFETKQRVVETLLRKIKPPPKIVWDFGANDGRFSEITAGIGAYSVSFDIDPLATEKNFLKSRPQALKKMILPLIQDLTNPSPPLGWGHEERMSLKERSPSDVILALALVHHLAIGNNLPLADISKFFAKLTSYLVIEFVPKSDSKARQLLGGRQIQFASYNQTNFEKSFGQHFDLVEKQRLTGSQRVIYLYKAKRAK